MTTDHKELRRRAEAATPGPWDVGAGSITKKLLGEDDNGDPTWLTKWIVSFYGPSCENQDEAKNNAAFIAAANPQIVLSLLDEIDALKAENMRLTEANNIMAIELDNYHELKDENEMLKAGNRLLSDAPCDKCGYNGEGYYQPDKHPCAEEHHEARKAGKSKEVSDKDIEKAYWTLASACTNKDQENALNELLLAATPKNAIQGPKNQDVVECWEHLLAEIQAHGVHHTLHEGTLDTLNKALRAAEEHHEALKACS